MDDTIKINKIPKEKPGDSAVANQTAQGIVVPLCGQIQRSIGIREAIVYDSKWDHTTSEKYADYETIDKGQIEYAIPTIINTNRNGATIRLRDHDGVNTFSTIKNRDENKNRWLRDSQDLRSEFASEANNQLRRHDYGPNVLF